jgi:hypothetical protein
MLRQGVKVLDGVRASAGAVTVCGAGTADVVVECSGADGRSGVLLPAPLAAPCRQWHQAQRDVLRCRSKPGIGHMLGARCC